ncbi:MAG: PepSY domain-containing protein [Planctomycetes bacterium]|nr:PepSY domain-containing protein [Planctomycetota bacterium]
MKHYRINRTVHKWFGIIFAIALLNFSITGLLLLEKKKFDWLQPPTQTGSEGTVDQFITNQQLFKIVFDEKHPDFKNMEDIDRVDFRPGKRIFKVRSENNYSEIQVDAVNGKILSIAKRNSDKIEAWHDGSIFGEFVHQYIMPVVAIITVILTITGSYLWLAPAIKRRAK